MYCKDRWRNYSCVVSSPIGNSFHVHSLIPSVLQYWMTPWEDGSIRKHKNDMDGYKWSHLDPSPWNLAFCWDPRTFAILSSIYKSTNLKPTEICCLFCWVHSVKIQQRTSWLTAVKLSLSHTSEIQVAGRQGFYAVNQIRCFKVTPNTVVLQHTPVPLQSLHNVGGIVCGHWHCDHRLGFRWIFHQTCCGIAGLFAEVFVSLHPDARVLTGDINDPQCFRQDLGACLVIR